MASMLGLFDASSEMFVSADLKVQYGYNSLGPAPVVVQGILYSSRGGGIGGTAGNMVTLFDAHGEPSPAYIQREVLKLTHLHPSYVNSIGIAVGASARGDFFAISDLITRVESCRDMHKFHLDNHDCTYRLKSLPVMSSSSVPGPISERLVSVRGVVQLHYGEHDKLLLDLQEIYRSAFKGFGV